jgi:hypothetical protein
VADSLHEYGVLHAGSVRRASLTNVARFSR